MTQIPLMQPRLEGGANRAPAVKTPYALAEGDQMQQAGQMVAGFAGDVFAGLVKARAANEQAAFRGVVHTAGEEWKTYLAANPGVSFEDMTKERQRLLERIRGAAEQATTPAARAANTLWLTESESWLGQQMQTDMEGIRKRQEFAISDENVSQLIKRGDSIGLYDHYFGENGMVAAGLYSREYAEAKFANEDTIIGKAAAEMEAKAIEEQIGVRLDQMVADMAAADRDEDGNPDGWGPTLAWLADPKTTKELAAEFDVSADLIDSAIENIQTKASIQRAAEKTATEQAQETERAEIVNDIVGGKLDGIEDRIMAMPTLNVDQKLDLRALAKSEAEAIIKGKPSPLKTTDPAVYWQAQQDVEDRKIDKKGLRNLVGKGLSADDYEKFGKMLDAEPGGKKDPRMRPGAIRARDSIGRLRQLDISSLGGDVKEVREGTLATEQKYLGIERQLDDWIEANADDPDFDTKLEAKVQQLLRPEVERVVQGRFDRLRQGVGKAAVIVIGAASGDPFMASRVKARAARQTDDAVAELQSNPVWGTLDAETQAEAQQIIENGGSLQEILDWLEAD